MTDDLQTAIARRRIYEYLGLATVLSTALWIYRGAFLGFFEQDDFGWLYSTRFRDIAEYLHCFFRFNDARTYRPLSQETFFLVFQKVFGLWPPAFHAMSVACHLIASALVYRLLRKFASPLPSLVGAMFFAAHSAHLRSVYWISAIPEPMALIFYLAALLSFIRFDREENHRFYVWSVVAMGLGMLSKESILSLPLVLAIYCIHFSRKRLPWTLPHFALAGLYAVFRTLSISRVETAPYKLTFGHDAWHNLLSYLSWTAGFSEPLLKLKLKWEIPVAYALIAALFVLVTAALVVLSRDRKIATFSILWFLAALQPVLYFQNHIFSYYLAPALPAVALLLASALEDLPDSFAWRRWVLVPPVLCFCLWSSYASVKREGRWWNERSFIAREIVSKAPEMVRQVPPERTAYIFGFGEYEFGAMQRDAAFKAFGISPYRFIPYGLSSQTRTQIERLYRGGGLGKFYCFVYTGGRFENWTTAFRLDPRAFLLIQPPDGLERMARAAPVDSAVRLEVSKAEITAGSDLLTIRVRNLGARAVDVLYTLDGRLMPAVTKWPLDTDGASTVALGASTPRGDYFYRAVRDSTDPDLTHWYPSEAHVRVK